MLTFRKHLAFRKGEEEELTYGIMDRRTALLTFGGVVLTAGCKYDGASSECLDKDIVIPLRVTPRPLTFYPLLNHKIDDLNLFKCLNVAVPPQEFLTFPLSLSIHLLRLWGITASFDYPAAADGTLDLKWGELMLGLLVDDTLHARFAKSSFEHLLVPSDFGVMVRTTRDAGMGQEWAATHPGILLSVAAELGLPSSYSLNVYQRPNSQLSDAIQDEARRIDYSVELEWQAAGLTRYIDIPFSSSWRSKCGKSIDMDSIAMQLCNMATGQGACRGAHVPFSLCGLLTTGRQDRVVSDKVIQVIESRLRMTSDRLEKTQLTDGAWNTDWAEDSTETSNDRPFTWGGGEIDKISMTGHHLEWMAICPPELRPSTYTIMKSMRYLAQSIQVQGYLAIQDDWHLFLPLSHAVKALANACGFTTPKSIYSFWSANRKANNYSSKRF